MRESLTTTTPAIKPAASLTGTNTANAVGGQAIELPDVTHSVFLKVLDFIYTDSVGIVSLQEGISLLIASDEFALDPLKAMCEDLIGQYLSTETVVSILAASHKHNAKRLKCSALEYMANNWNPGFRSALSNSSTGLDLLLEIMNFMGSALSHGKGKKRPRRDTQ